MGGMEEIPSHLNQVTGHGRTGHYQHNSPHTDLPILLVPAYPSLNPVNPPLISRYFRNRPQALPDLPSTVRPLLHASNVGVVSRSGSLTLERLPGPTFHVISPRFVPSVI